MTKKVEVLNRTMGGVGYVIPDMNVKRSFTAHETKKISVEELEALSYIPGGKRLIEDCLLIKDYDAAVEALNGEPEQEYWMEEEDIKELMNNGSLDEFLDCLDFCPSGVLEIIKKLAVSMPLNDSAKREAILNKTGFDVDNALRHLKEEKDAAKEENAETVKPNSKRRVAPKEKPQVPKYKVVNKKED